MIEKMDLFTPIVSDDKLHPNFVNEIRPSRVGEREIIQGWAEGFPDRDGKFVKEFQTTFNSSFWELYLHGLFRAYGFEMDWSKASPDFNLMTKKGSVIVEAVTANAADGATPEWKKSAPMTQNVIDKKFWPLNREAIIRLSNALSAKVRYYNKSYANLSHVKGKPFVIAVAPFEQPDFQYQYDRPIQALLYDYYVDEDAYYAEPDSYPNGPPGVHLGSVEKNNGALIDLGVFCDDQWSEVSAVIFSCVATVGKAIALSNRPMLGIISSTWGGLNGPYPKIVPAGNASEDISDGLQIFHNPHAKHPLDTSIFRRKRVVQHYVQDGEWVHESWDDCLHSRTTFSLNSSPNPSASGSNNENP